MRATHQLCWGIAFVVLAKAATVCGQDQPPRPVPETPPSDSIPASDADVEVLTRGPIHEAFADALRYSAEPGIIVDRQPPVAIEELPPLARPEGQDVVWIPGYWGWDDERGDFIWVTGVYRNAPPGHRWVPGYWAQTDAGWQWVSGFWVPDDQTEVTYLPEPPESLEQGPSSPSPGAGYFWAPGYWDWQGSGYGWRGGFWTSCHANWVWCPTYYCWTPRGYVCVNGRWDRPWATRGLCFAPVFYHRPVYSGPDYYYRPRVALNAASLIWNLFVRPGYNHYYFGDYYGSRYAGFGYRPWFDSHQGRFSHDPLLAYYRWQYGRTNPRWAGELRNRYRQLDEDSRLRPPRTFADFEARRREGELDARNAVTATISELAARGPANVRMFEPESRTAAEAQQSAQRFRRLNGQRERAETARIAADQFDRDADRRTGRTSEATGRFELPPVVQDRGSDSRKSAATERGRLVPRTRTDRQGGGSFTAPGRERVVPEELGLPSTRSRSNNDERLRSFEQPSSRYRARPSEGNTFDSRTERTMRQQPTPSFESRQRTQAPQSRTLEPRERPQGARGFDDSLESRTRSAPQTNVPRANAPGNNSNVAPAERGRGQSENQGGASRRGRRK